MINKVHFGKRIASLRKKSGLSQAELADKLGVTSQAVSKWECGSALPDIDLLLELSNLYHVTINELLEDVNLIAKLANRPFETDEITCFVPKAERDYNAEWAKNIVSEKWVSRNWNDQKNRNNEIYNDVAKRIVDHGGLILETGAGPGGGFMPSILKTTPTRRSSSTTSRRPWCANGSVFWTANWTPRISITRHSISATSRFATTASTWSRTAAGSGTRRAARERR